MADTSETRDAGNQAEQTWTGFKTMMTWGTVFCFLVGAGVVLLIAS